MDGVVGGRGGLFLCNYNKIKVGDNKKAVVVPRIG